MSRMFQIQGTISTAGMVLSRRAGRPGEGHPGDAAAEDQRPSLGCPRASPSVSVYARSDEKSIPVNRRP